MKRITLASPAKLNLFLKVTHKRPDGYHNIVTLFERINLCDQITLTTRKRDEIRIDCDHSQVPKGSKNLAFRAAEVLKEAFSFQNGVDIRIKKKIPVAAGLAGGSSNAATVLMGLNQLWKLSLRRSDLVALAKEIGSDVPFFIHDCSWAIGTQRGDNIKRVSLGEKWWHILVVPRIKVYSREVFTRFKMKLTKKGDDVNILTRALKEKDLSKMQCHLVNDLESTVVQLHPSLSRLKDRLQQIGALGVCLSGSGPSIFGLAASQYHAEKLKHLLGQTYRQVFVTRTL